MAKLRRAYELADEMCQLSPDQGAEQAQRVEAIARRVGSSTWELLARARGALARGRAREATRLFEQVIREGGPEQGFSNDLVTWAQAVRGLAAAHEARGKLELASDRLAEIEKALERSADHAPELLRARVAFRDAVVWEKRALLPSAAIAYGQLPERHGDNTTDEAIVFLVSWARLRRAKVLVGLARYEDALEALGDLLDPPPDDEDLKHAALRVSARGARSQALRGLGRTDEARMTPASRFEQPSHHDQTLDDQVAEARVRIAWRTVAHFCVAALGTLGCVALVRRYEHDEVLHIVSLLVTMMVAGSLWMHFLLRRSYALAGALYAHRLWGCAAAVVMLIGLLAAVFGTIADYVNFAALFGANLTPNGTRFVLGIGLVVFLVLALARIGRPREA